MNRQTSLPDRPVRRVDDIDLNWILITAGLVILCFMTACTGSDGAAKGAPPPPEVSVVMIAPESVPVITELPGRVDAIRVAEVRARATGILLHQLFKDGAEVKAGDVLFEIDPAPLEAALASAQANQAKAEASRKQAAADLVRSDALLKGAVITKQEYDQKLAMNSTSDADVEGAKAAVQTAQLNLGYTKVTAPISGRIGKAKVTEGALVSASEATPLATVQQLDTVYFDFTQSSTELLRLRRAFESGQLKSADSEAAKVTLLLEDGSAYPEQGRLLFSDVTVDQTTGMVTMRAEFPNPDRVLLPGVFARGRLEQARHSDAITVPQRAVTRGANGTSTVLIVGADDKMEVRTLAAGQAYGDKWIVSDGLKAGDRVIVEGLQKAKPGAVVKPVLVSSKTEPSQLAQTGGVTPLN
jgi:membrane fusion protein (multidrug efflux system)